MKGKKLTKKIRALLSIFITVAMLVVMGGYAMPVSAAADNYYNLTTLESSHTIHDGVLIYSFTPDDSTGTGYWHSVLRLSANTPAIKGYNSDYKQDMEFDEDFSWTESILLTDVPVVQVGGTDYREFQLDINQTGNGEEPLLTIDQIEVWLSNDAPTTPGYLYPFGDEETAGDFKHIWDLDTATEDNVILLNYNLNPGSGKRDFKIQIPDSLFVDGLTHPYVVLYTEHGAETYSGFVDIDGDPDTTTDPTDYYEVTDAIFGNNDGFEEWGVAVYENSKAGTKYNDLNRNGVWDWTDNDGNDIWSPGDTGEPPLGGWIIFVDVDGDGLLTPYKNKAHPGDPWAETDADTGRYIITGIPDGTYNVYEVMQDDWYNSQPGGGCYENEVFDGGMLLAGNDFGNYQVATKSGTKYEDLNADGDMDAEDTGLDGWTIAAFADNDNSGTLNAVDTLADSDVTSGGGNYELTLSPGRYIVVEQVSDQANWFESPDNGTTSVNTYDSNYGEYGYDVTLESGEVDSGNDFANFQQATKSGTKYEDENVDGIMNGSDAGLDGWTIAAFLDIDASNTLTASDTLADSDVTSGGGNYELTLDPGTYIIVEEIQTDWFESPDDDTTLVNTFDSTYGEYGYVITVESDDVHPGNDFANFQQGTKDGMKYEDENADGEYNGSDAGLSGWTIAAFLDVDSSGTLNTGDTWVKDALTDTNGDYELSLDPGDYIIVEEIQTDWFESPDDD
ncbi:hypothetical protein ACFLS8_04715, partial [Chloroflexota bacterium]